MYKNNSGLIGKLKVSKSKKKGLSLTEKLVCKTRYYSYTNRYQWGAVFEDGDLYKGAHGGQGLYISPAKDLVIAYFGTSNIDRERNQLNVISRQLSKSGLFDLE